MTVTAGPGRSSPRSTREEVVAGEAGRFFDGRWGFRRDDAVEELRRYRQALASRLDPGAAAALDQVLQLAAAQPAAVAETRAEAGLRRSTRRCGWGRRSSCWRCAGQGTRPVSAAVTASATVPARSTESSADRRTKPRPASSSSHAHSGA